MKIGIMGGTFDPIHKGHLMLGEYAYKQYGLDKIWFMPNGTPPHKDHAKIGSKAEDRMNMVRLAIEGNEAFELQTYEILNQDINYSYKTMEHFRAVYTQDEFYFIIGADSLFAIESWVKPERLLKTCVILAAYRDEKSTEEMKNQIAYLNQKYQADIRLLNTPNVDISSSEIINMLQEQESVCDMVPEAVYQDIKEKQLYKECSDSAV